MNSIDRQWGHCYIISTTNRSDIAAAVSILCRRVNSPHQCDWNTGKQVMRYLKGTIDLKLKLKAVDNLQLRGFVDADLANDKTERKSTSDSMFQHVISSLSKKQGTVALSSTEAEYISAALAS